MTRMAEIISAELQAKFAESPTKELESLSMKTFDISYLLQFNHLDSLRYSAKKADCHSRLIRATN